MSTGFFLVWNPSRKAPTFRHATKAQATAEAQRLANLCRGEDFFVLKGVSVSRVENITQSVAFDVAAYKAEAATSEATSAPLLTVTTYTWSAR